MVPLTVSYPVIPMDMGKRDKTAYKIRGGLMQSGNFQAITRSCGY